MKIDSLEARGSKFIAVTTYSVTKVILTRTETPAIAPGVTLLTPHNFPAVFGEFGIFAPTFSEAGPKRIDRNI
jgi:hypothetical protein